MRRIVPLLLACIAIAACNRGQPVQPATPMTSASASATTTVGGISLQSSTIALADLNAQVASRYRITPGKDGIVLVLMARDAAGDAVDTRNLQLSATASTLPDPPQPLELRMIDTNGLTDYIGVLHANAPATAQFRITAINGSARADITTTAELRPR